jgi:hypothetical protein
MAVDPDLNVTYDCIINDYQGLIIVETSLTGSVLSATFTADLIAVAIEITGEFVQGSLFDASTDYVPVYVYLEGDPVIEQEKTNWVGWSKIGQATFVQDMTNDSGYRPMPWRGTVFYIKRLGKTAIVYGTGGVTMLYPVAEPAPTFGMKDILTIGVLNKNCIVGDEKVHFFIDRFRQLWKLESEKPAEKLGYDEFIRGLTDPIMHFDPAKNRVYINDASEGYTLTPYGLGGGYPNLTGFCYREGLKTIVSPAAIGEPPSLEIVTDTIDFGYRGLKSIESVQVGVEADEQLYTAVSYRYKKSDDWSTTPFVRLNDEGVAFLRVTALEFRVHVKNLTYDPIDIDYLSIRFKRSDLRYVRGPVSLQASPEDTYDS